MTETQELIPRREENFSLGRLMPQNIKELYWFAERVAESGMFPNVANAKSAFLMMAQGVELGLSPLQSLRELNVINGRVDVPASVRAARIQSSPKTEVWNVESDDNHCTIRTKRRDRSSGYVVTIRREDMPQADIAKHKTHMADWLFARAVRRASRQYFADLNLGMETDDSPEPDRVINIAAVEKTVGDEAVGTCEECGEPTYLHPNRKGGVYSECKNGHRQSPPQEVRDVVRGRSDEFVEPEFLENIESEPRDPNSEEVVELRKEWTEEILNALHDDMVNNAPHAIHKSVLTNWGWDGKMKVADWLDSKTLEDLSDFHDEIMAVEL